MRYASRPFLLFMLCSAIGCGDFAIGPGMSDYHYDLCEGYRLWRTSAHQISIDPPDGSARIGPKIVEVAWDSRFIIAKRQALKLRGDHPADFYELPDPGKFDYWVVDTQNQDVFGPLDASDFAAKRNKLGVSNALTLKDVYLYPH